MADILEEAPMKEIWHMLAACAESIDLHKPIHSPELTAVKMRSWISVVFQVEMAVFDIIGCTFAAIGKVVAKTR
jgi:hypothetical protein